jgi:hypothetical protein
MHDAQEEFCEGSANAKSSDDNDYDNIFVVTKGLHNRKCTILEQFISFIQLKSQRPLSFWQVINPFGRYSKGFKQALNKTSINSSSCTLKSRNPQSLVFFAKRHMMRLWGRDVCLTECGVVVVFLGVIIVGEFKEAPCVTVLG